MDKILGNWVPDKGVWGGGRGQEKEEESVQVHPLRMRIATFPFSFDNFLYVGSVLQELKWLISS